MLAVIITVLTLAIQLYAVILAVKLVTVTKHRFAWGSLALGLIIIMFRRAFEMASYLELTGYEIGLAYTLSSGAVSLCMAVGMHMAKRMIDRMMETNERLTISEAYYRGLMDYGTEAIYIADPQGQYLNANPRGLELTGYTLGQLTKLTVMDILDKEEVERMPIRWDSLKSGELVISQRKFRKANGEAIFAEVHTRRLPDGNYMASVRDISEHHAAIDRLRFQSELLDTVQQAVIAFAEDGRVTYCNKYAIEMYGWQEREVIGTQVETLLNVNLTEEMIQQIRQCMISGRSWTGEISYKDSAGNWSPAMLIQSPIFDQTMNRIGSIGVSFDLTELQAAEQAAARAEHLLREFIDSAPFGAHHYELHPNGELRFSGANKTAERILHFDHSVLIGQRIEDAFPSLDGPVPEIYRSVALTGVPWESSQVRYTDGVVDGAYEVSAFQTGANRMVALFKDVTDRVRAEEALRQREIRLQTINDIARGITNHEPTDSILERALMSMFQAYPQHRVAYGDITAEGILHFRRSLQPSGRKSLRSQQLDLAKVPDHLAKLNRSESVLISSFKDIDPDNEKLAELSRSIDVLAMLVVPVNLNGRVIGALGFDNNKPTTWTDYEMKMLVEVAGYLEIAHHDAHLNHSRLMVEESLRESEERFRLALRNSPVIMFHQDKDLRYIWNHNPRDEQANNFIIGKTDHEILPTELADRFVAIKREIMATGVGQRFETDIVYMGQTTYWDCTLEPLIDRNGEVIGVTGVSTEITSSKLIEQQLRNSEERFRTLADNLPAYVWTTDPVGNVLYFNRQTLDALGGTLESLGGSQWLATVHPEDRPAFEQLLQNAMGACLPFECTIRVRRVDGQYRSVVNRGVPQFNAQGEPVGYVGTCFDITERLESENHFRDHVAQLRLALQAVRSGTFKFDIAENRLEWSEELQELYGIPAGTFKGTFKEWTDRLLPEELQETLSKLAQDVSRGGGMRNEFRISRLDNGEIRWIEALGEVQVDAKGQPVRMVGVNTDITERKHYEAELRHAEFLSSRMRRAFLDLNKCVALEETLDPLLQAAFDLSGLTAGGIYLIHDQAAELVRDSGLPESFRQAVTSMPIDTPYIKLVMESERGIYLPTDLPGLKELCEQTGLSHVYSFPLRSGRGDVFGFLNLASFSPEPPREQDVHALETLVSEVGIIFHRLRTEETLEEESVRRRVLIDQSHDGIVVLDKNGKVFEANQRFAELLGYTSEEVKSLYVWDWDYQWDREQLLEMIRVCGPEGAHFETIHRRKDGTTFYTDISTNGAQFGRQKLIFCVCRDVTERKLAERALLESEARLTQAQRLARLGSFEFDLVSGEAVWSDEMYRILGYEPSAIVPSLALLDRHIHPDDIQQVKRERIAGHQSGGGFGIASRIIRVDGKERYVQTVTEPLYDQAGEVCKVFGTIHDVTEQRQAESALRKSEAQYRALADFTYDWEFWFGPQNEPIYISPSCTRITGYLPQEFIADPDLFLRILHPEDQDAFRNHSLQITESGEVSALEVRIFDRKGNQRWISHVCRPIVGQDGTYLGIRGSNSDITARKAAEADRTRLEEQLRLAQKLETIGTMAAGIAHDFNNLLVPIIGYTELVSSDKQPGRFTGEYLQEVLKAAYRAKGLVAHILAFSRQQTGERKPVQIENVVAEVIAALSKDLDNRITARYSAPGTTSPVLADPGQMYQILMNLCENAVQAMVEGGELSVETSPFESSPLACPNCKRRLHGKMIRIQVRDTGCGMDEATIKRIFDPFFTTKGVGKGTGLGLAVTHGIVTQHSGHICAESKLGEGTSFHLFLPVADKAQSSIPQVLPAAVEGGNESILVIDDEPAVANSHAASLTSLGYRVTVACDPRAAITVFQERPTDFDCVLLDQRMPEMTGDQVAVNLLRIRPDIPIVLCSGFSDSLELKEAHDLGIRDVVMKPVIAADLGKALRKAIKRSDSVSTK
ncbi:MAG: PAS domain S-box protein [bacterium]|nr:PAS domain S-box protein [bacterium]